MLAVQYIIMRGDGIGQSGLVVVPSFGGFPAQGVVIELRDAADAVGGPGLLPNEVERNQ